MSHKPLTLSAKVALSRFRLPSPRAAWRWQPRRRLEVEDPGKTGGLPSVGFLGGFKVFAVEVWRNFVEDVKWFPGRHGIALGLRSGLTFSAHLPNPHVTVATL